MPLQGVVPNGSACASSIASSCGAGLSGAGAQASFALVGALFRRSVRWRAGAVPEALDARPEAGPRGRRQVPDELLAVALRHQALVQDADDAAVGLRTDEATEPLLEADLRLGHAELREPVTARCGDRVRSGAS